MTEQIGGPFRDRAIATLLAEEMNRNAINRYLFEYLIRHSGNMWIVVRRDRRNRDRVA